MIREKDRLIMSASSIHLPFDLAHEIENVAKSNECTLHDVVYFEVVWLHLHVHDVL